MRAGPEAVMARALAAVGFDERCPDPAAAWAAFREFASTPLPDALTVSVGYECFHVSDRDDVLWLTFERSLDVGAGTGWMCGCCLARTVPETMWSVTDSDWWWPESGTLPRWFAEVERRPSFRDCLSLDGWRWVGLSS
ncbi:hypothetical protein P12x_000926 [Tundrisphaera lichenicola]|uniref:hypothetical protein n=1 Tax=Tundrisphaera lichenicola TaxID=2029860 RepID=UPI003EBC789F